MKKSEIAKYRLSGQCIEDSKFSSPKEIVQWLGAVQAQDYNMAKWAIGLRVPGSTDEQIEKAINKAEIIRMHLLRPTWHFVAAKDVRWMLELTSPRIRKATALMNRHLELDDKIFRKTNKIITNVLQNGKQLTRQELMVFVNKAGIKTDALRAAHILFEAELNAIVCSGAKKDKQFTYALLDERVKPCKAFTKQEALAELAKRYFASHGPASLQDFTWWSGLTAGDAKLALESVKHLFVSETVEGQVYWMSSSSSFEKANSFHLLPAYDEFMISYKDRTASLPLLHTKATITVNGIFKPIIVVDGSVKGLWKPVQKKNRVAIELTFFNAEDKPGKRKMAAALKNYSTFLNTDVVVQDQ